jgi:hypothetical protein
MVPSRRTADGFWQAIDHAVDPFMPTACAYQLATPAIFHLAGTALGESRSVSGPPPIAATTLTIAKHAAAP